MKFILVLQIALGLVTIAIALFVLSYIQVNKVEPQDISIIIDALHSASPTPQQIQRAATILANQKQLLETSTSTIETNFKAFIYNGLVLLFFGTIVLMSIVRLNPPASAGQL